MSRTASIENFLDGTVYAVAGASRSRAKYGNKVLRCYVQAGRRVYAVTPNAETVEGLQAYPDLTGLPEVPYGVSVVTPPGVTLEIVRQAIELGIGQVWMQPGAESEAAVQLAEQAGLNVIHSGPCILVALGFSEA